MSVLSDLGPRKTLQSGLFYKTASPHSPPLHAFCLSPPTIPPTNPAHLSLANLSCGGVLNPGFHPWVGNPDVTGIPQVNYSTSQQQLTSMQAEVAYLTKTPITTKPVVHTN